MANSFGWRDEAIMMKVMLMGRQRKNGSKGSKITLFAQKWNETRTLTQRQIKLSTEMAEDSDRSRILMVIILVGFLKHHSAKSSNRVLKERDCSFNLNLAAQCGSDFEAFEA